MTVKIPRQYWPALSVIIAIIMAVMDGTIVNVALPTLTHEFHVAADASIWISNAYQLVIVMFLLIFATIGDLLSYKKVFLWGVAGFTMASGLCALAPTFGLLVAARVIQGIGAAGIMSVNTALVRFIFPHHLLGRGMSINAMAVAVSAAAGPTVAGIILSALSWHWLFVINLPLGIFAFWLGSRLLPENALKQHRCLDWRSCIGNVLTFGLLILVMQHMALENETWKNVILIVVFVLLAWSYIRHQLHQEIPLLPVDLLKIPLFSLSVITSICSYMAQMLGMVSLPFYLHNTLNYPPVQIGLLLTPWPLTTMIVAPIAGKLIEKYHPGLIGSIGMGLYSIGFLSLYIMPDDVTQMDILWRIMLCGAGFGLFQTPNNVTLVSSAPVKRSGGASGMLAMSRLIGQTVGTTLVSMIFVLSSPAQGTQTCLLAAAIIAALAVFSSFSRISQGPLPTQR